MKSNSLLKPIKIPTLTILEVFVGFCNFSSFARIFYCYPTFFAKTVNSVNSRAFSYLQMSFSLEHHFHAFVISRFFFFFSIKSKSRDFFLVEVEHHFHKDFFLVSQFLMLSSLFEKSVNSRIFFLRLLISLFNSYTIRV